MLLLLRLEPILLILVAFSCSIRVRCYGSIALSDGPTGGVVGKVLNMGMVQMAKIFARNKVARGV
jgi:hypothetical protein